MDDDTLREKIANFVDGGESVRDFRRWFIPLAFHATAEGKRDRLLGLIDLRLMEYSDRMWTEVELRREIDRILQREYRKSPKPKFG